MNSALKTLVLFALGATLAIAQRPATQPTAESRPSTRPTIAGEKDLLHVDFDGTVLDLYTFRPANYRGERMIMVMHGVLRNADEYRDDAAPMAERFQALIVAPKFDEARFPSRRYQQGGIRGPDSRAARPEDWTYAYIPKIAAGMRRRESKPDLPYWIIGHSAGGQFVTRMAAFQETGAERLVAANPGTDLFPTRELAFGYGFGGLPDELANDDRLRRYLAAPLTLYLGTADDHPDENFDASPAAMKQGPSRYDRGRECFRRGEALARERGWPFAWRLVLAPGVDHDHGKMFDHPQCEVALFGPRAESRSSSH